MRGAGLLHAADSHWREGDYLTTETIRVAGSDDTTLFVGIARAADATNGVLVDADVGAEAPVVHRIVVGLVIGGSLSAATGVLLILMAQRRRPERR